MKRWRRTLATARWLFESGARMTDRGRRMGLRAAGSGPGGDMLFGAAYRRLVRRWGEARVVDVAGLREAGE